MKDKNLKYLDIYNKLDFSKIIDHPNILIAANFWDEERYLAAKVCYRFMREIDDFIDNYKSEFKEIEEGRKDSFIFRVNEWINSLSQRAETAGQQNVLRDTFEKFRIPFWTMETFAKSMIYDINNNGFNTLDSFLEYSRGASIAPASVFVHLCGISEGPGGYNQPLYDVRTAATPCAIFSYLVHIIRDFQKDQLNNLNYFADDLILKYGLNREILHDMALGAPIRDGFRLMIKEYYNLADQYRIQTFEMIREIRPLVGPRYQLSLEIIFNLYLMVYERIDIKGGTFTREELNPTAEEISERVYRTIEGFSEVKQKKFAIL
jgi:phytoene/squalene synthetase